MPLNLSDPIAEGRTAQLLDGLAAELAAWDIASYERTRYDGSQLRPIYFGPNEPVDSPPERLILTPSGSYIQRGNITVNPIGFNYRGPVGGDALGPQNFLDMLERRLHKLAHHTFGQVRIGLVWRQSAGLIGKDTSRRYGGSATYLFRGINPSVNS